jgi:hypothetical protein
VFQSIKPVFGSSIEETYNTFVALKKFTAFELRGKSEEKGGKRQTEEEKREKEIRERDENGT